MKFKSLSNEVYLENNRVIKTSKNITSLFLDKKNEYKFLEEIKFIKNNVILKPLSFKFYSSKLISEYPYLHDWSVLNLNELNKNKIAAIADSIIDFHNIELKRDKIKIFNHRDYLDLFLNNIKNFDLEYDQKKLDFAISKLDLLNDNLVVSHNDLIKENFLLKDNEIKIIDYDFVMLNNKYFDIASFISESLEKDEHINQFIEILLEKKYLNISDLVFVKDEIFYQDILWYCWANYMWEKTNGKDFFEIMKIKRNYIKFRKLNF